MGLEVSRVTSSFVVMTVGEDGASEGGVRGNVDMTFVCKDAVVIFPVREMRPEGSGDILQGRLQMLEDEGVGF